MTLLLALMVALATIGLAHAARALAVDNDGPGPSAAIDGNFNKYVFWEGPQGGLREAFYDQSQGEWTGPKSIANTATMGSEPSVAVSSSQFASNGDAYQFVFWVGSGSLGNLYEEYWNGSWNGPYDIGMGNVAGGNDFCCTVGVTSIPGSNGIYVGWRGANGKFWYTRTSTPTNPSSWSDAATENWSLGPEPTLLGEDGGTVNAYFPDAGFADLEGGTIGHSSSPTDFGDGPLGSTLTSDEISDSEICDCDVDQVDWEGTNGGIWQTSISLQTGNELQKLTNNQLGSTPTAIYNNTLFTWDYYYVCPTASDLCQYAPSTDTVTDLGMGPIPSP